MKTKLAGIVGSALCATAAFAFDASGADEKGSVTAGGSAEASATASVSAPNLGESDSKDRGLWQQSTMNGPTGLVRTVAGDSGAAGTFRLGVMATYFSGSGFLCPKCQLPDYSLVTTGEDDVSQVALRTLLSVTPLE